MAGEVSETSRGERTRLEEVSIKGLGVIESASIEFAPGLNVITGETGAGKTMVLTALSLVLGGKADSDLIRKGSERLVVSGRFSLSEKMNPRIDALVAEHEVELDEDTLLLSRSVNSDGKSRAMLCGVTTTASVLSAFASELIDIHGQHGTLQLAKSAKQRELLDRFGGLKTEEALGDYQGRLKEYEGISNRISELKKALADREREIISLQELLSEYRKLKPNSGDFQAIDMEIRKLESVEDIRIALVTALGALEGDSGEGETNSANSSLGIARRALQSVRDKDHSIEGAAASIESAFFEAVEAASELRSFLENLEADPKRLEDLLNRRAALRAFVKRFGDGSDLDAGLDDVLKLAETAKARIQDLTGGESRIEELENEQSEIYSRLIMATKALTAIRRESAKGLDEAVTRELRELAMPKASFQCSVTEDEVLQSKGSLIPPSRFTQYGLSDVEMLFSAHSDGELLPISKAASGGELSRLMLALEVVVAATSPRGTYLFDEIDAGIGGKAALEVGRRLKRLSQSAQIIVVTHLPQVAIWADNHLRVIKDSSGSITESSVTIIDRGERESEIARMLSGLEDSEHAQEHARELLDLVKG